VEAADFEESSCSVDRLIFGAENSLGLAKTETDGLLRFSCRQFSQRPPKVSHRPRQPLARLTHENIVDGLFATERSKGSCLVCLVVMFA